MFEKFSERDRQILKSIAPFLIIVVLFYIVGKFAVSQILNIKNQINVAKTSQSVLSDKLTVLKSVSKIAVAGVDSVLFALPKTNPSVLAITQLKNLAAGNALVITDVKTSVAGNVDKGGVGYINTTFSVTGSREQIMSFIKGIENIAPITFVEKMELNENAGLNVANIGTRTYYAPLPVTIPTVSESITDLTASEKEMLSQMGKLIRPIMASVVNASSSGTNSNPFGE